MDRESLLSHQPPDSSHEAWPAGRTSSSDGRSSRFYENTWPQPRKTFSCTLLGTSVLTGLILCVVLLNVALLVLLKHAISMERSSTMGMHAANNASAATPSGLTYQPPVTFVTDCGGILHVPFNGLGYIVYKNGSQYDNDERCAWIIDSEANKVQVKFIQHEFNLTLTQGTIWDGFTIGQMDGSREEFGCHRWKVTDYSKSHVAVTPFVLYFTSDGGTRRGGFAIELTPVTSSGSNDEHVRTMYANKRNRGTIPLGHLSGPVGVQRRRSLLETFAVFQPASSNSCWKRNFTCVTASGLKPRCCYVLAYEMDGYHDGGSCHQATLQEGSIATSKALVVLYWLQNDSPKCGIAWEDVQLKLSYNKDLFKAECT